MEKGDVQSVEFGDQIRITEAEVQRIRALHGLEPDADDATEAA
jgi:hypothetical protein